MPPLIRTSHPTFMVPVSQCKAETYVVILKAIQLLLENVLCTISKPKFITIPSTNFIMLPSTLHPSTKKFLTGQCFLFYLPHAPWYFQKMKQIICDYTFTTK